MSFTASQRITAFAFATPYPNIALPLLDARGSIFMSSLSSALATSRQPESPKRLSFKVPYQTRNQGTLGGADCSPDKDFYAASPVDGGALPR